MAEGLTWLDVESLTQLQHRKKVNRRYKWGLSRRITEAWPELQGKNEERQIQSQVELKGHCGWSEMFTHSYSCRKTAREM